MEDQEENSLIVLVVRLGGAVEGAACTLALALALALTLALGAVAADLVLAGALIVGAWPPAAAAAGVLLAPMLVRALRLQLLVAALVLISTRCLLFVASSTTSGAARTAAPAPGMDLVIACGTWLLAMEPTPAHAFVLAVILAPEFVAVVVGLVRGWALLLVASSVSIATTAASRSTSSALIMTASAAPEGRPVAIAVVLRASLVVLIALVTVAGSSAAAVIVAGALAASTSIERPAAEGALIRLASRALVVLAPLVLLVVLMLRSLVSFVLHLRCLELLLPSRAIWAVVVRLVDLLMKKLQVISGIFLAGLLVVVLLCFSMRALAIPSFVG